MNTDTGRDTTRASTVQLLLQHKEQLDTSAAENQGHLAAYTSCHTHTHPSSSQTGHKST